MYLMRTRIRILVPKHILFYVIRGVFISGQSLNETVIENLRVFPVKTTHIK